MQWHKCECLLGECDKCGVNVLSLCPKEIEGFDDQVVTWKQFSFQQTMSMVGKPKKKLTLIHKSIVNELIACLKPKLQYFVHHNFVANWQDMQFRLYLKSM
jgi:hypothetical protein